MSIKFAFIGVAMFVIFFGYSLFAAPTLFDAAWILSTLSWPASLIALANRLPMAVLFGFGHKNIYVDLALLLVCGAFQYGVTGLLVGWCIEKLRS